jgi:hypothetical protein
MAVTCKQCGGPHPVWDCRASPARIAAYKAETTLKPFTAPIRKRTKFVAEIPPDTKLTTFRGKVIASAPTMPVVLVHPRINDLSPEGVAAIAEGIKAKRGRPKIHPDRKAYKAQKERERRARLKGAKP